MKIALAAAKLIDRDITFNLSQIKRYMQEAKQQGAELVCFGESFYQGFECFDWEYERDKNMAITLDSPEFSTLLQLTAQIGVDLMLGFMEREGEALYSSCALLSGGKLLHRYRRISKNWKEFQITDHHYQEGTTVEPFLYRGKTCLIALCGDLWIYPERFCQNADLLFLPVFVNFSIADWENTELVEYAKPGKSGVSEYAAGQLGGRQQISRVRRLLLFCRRYGKGCATDGRRRTAACGYMTAPEKDSVWLTESFGICAELIGCIHIPRKRDRR